jgi:hypothetical protein
MQNVPEELRTMLHELATVRRDLEMTLIVVHAIAYGPASHAKPYAMAILRRLESNEAREIVRVLDAPLSL